MQENRSQELLMRLLRNSASPFHTLEEGVLRAQETFLRTPQNPALPQLAFLQPSAGPVGVLCVDALGGRHGFVWEDADT